MKPCDPEIFQNGKSVAAIDGEARDVEGIVRLARIISGQRIDWHYSGGIAHILCIGDHAAAQDAIVRLQYPVIRLLRLFDGVSGMYRAGVSLLP